MIIQGGFARCYSVTDLQKTVFAVKVVSKPSLTSAKQRSKVFYFDPAALRNQDTPKPQSSEYC